MLHERQRITRRNRFCRRAPIHAGEMSSEVTTSQASSSGAALRKYRTLVRHATHPSSFLVSIGIGYKTSPIPI
jgi:hypothetical protein